MLPNLSCVAVPTESADLGVAVEQLLPTHVMILFAPQPQTQQQQQHPLATAAVALEFHICCYNSPHVQMGVVLLWYAEVDPPVCISEQLLVANRRDWHAVSLQLNNAWRFFSWHFWTARIARVVPSLRDSELMTMWHHPSSGLFRGGGGGIQACCYSLKKLRHHMARSRMLESSAFRPASSSCEALTRYREIPSSQIGEMMISAACKESQPLQHGLLSISGSGDRRTSSPRGGENQAYHEEHNRVLPCCRNCVYGSGFLHSCCCSSLRGSRYFVLRTPPGEGFRNASSSRPHALSA